MIIVINMKFKLAPVAYLECGKGGPGDLGDGSPQSPPVGSRGKAPVGRLGDFPQTPYRGFQTL